MAIESNKEAHARNKLESYVKKYKIFIDTCSLLHEATDKFWGNVSPMLQIYNSKIILPLRCWEELKKHSVNSEKTELADNANKCKEVLNILIKAGYVKIRGEDTDNFADNVFQVVFAKFRLTHNLLLITQDSNLAEDILDLNKSKSVKANPILVKRINQYGYLSDFFWNNNLNSDKRESENLTSDEAFRMCTQITTSLNKKIVINRTPNENETVYISQGAIKLGKELGAGGEAVVYETDDPRYAAKIYKKENITTRKLNKIKLMLSKKIACPGICYPFDIIYNSDQTFVGYLMPKAKGIELKKSIFAPKPVLLRKFPDWKKRDTVELCITILQKIKYLHDRNIIIGDINSNNILVVSPKEVYFVDADSFQIEEYPCPVGAIEFTAPEIQNRNFADFLRTMGNENFAVATLLFMIMLPGKLPYSQQGGEDLISNIKNMDFSYPFGENSNKKTPEGPWRYIWSHLTYDMKGAFYNTFRKDGKYSQENTRLSVNEWLPIFQKFLKLLDSGKYGLKDKMSEELFPTRLKRNPKADYVQCIICGREYEESQGRNAICKDCMGEGEPYRCKKCGKELIYTNYEKYIKKRKRHEVCKQCFEYGSKIRIHQRCVDCGSEFDVTNSQYELFQERGYHLPKRCEKCRELKKSIVVSSRAYDSNRDLKSHISNPTYGNYLFSSIAERSPTEVHNLFKA